MKKIRPTSRPIRNWLGAALVPLVLATAACGSPEESEPARLTTDGETLYQSIARLQDLGTTSEALLVAQLSEVFDGAGSYTVLAPTDPAFEALGENAERLLTLEERPLLAGLLRDHVLPGHVTPIAIRAAIEHGGGSAAMTTLGGGAITFQLDGETIVATHSNGAVARFVGEAVESSNGVVAPIDAVLTAPMARAGPPAQ
ncbi:hypothetical protein A9995_08190 [Erythrobacter sp. QSSC1-22B]|uniref:fasciclin domain-containing protein n=1 Tax=Erythrobacter sp. QSSC1-22B TaxID=1860125 RepID=UPI0008048594|nr:fasciclin domain-containing protein [Erythrobacter sp. QSSC1-22B]OBX19112.1 hypothetical protein A9995_08190 [Erythrobacter sp. QSSC1-22B]